eukprot:TRINITY_DN38421_c0_g1_i2.p1 TRINITY_DN38421_c0_g1~~TRINITY_DN38421_c0_g1_i2.p1  ORF type:complete len:355 (-),score=29.11 TRINITY_DN38421_c0_g1_i2:62-1126(-)
MLGAELRLPRAAERCALAGSVSPLPCTARNSTIVSEVIKFWDSRHAGNASDLADSTSKKCTECGLDNSEDFGKGRERHGGTLVVDSADAEYWFSMGFLVSLSELVSDAWQAGIDVLEFTGITSLQKGTSSEDDCLSSVDLTLVGTDVVATPLSRARSVLQWCPVLLDVDSPIRIAISDAFASSKDCVEMFLESLLLFGPKEELIIGYFILLAWFRYSKSGSTGPFADGGVHNWASPLLSLIRCSNSCMRLAFGLCLGNLELTVFPTRNVTAQLESVAREILNVNHMMSEFGDSEHCPQWYDRAVVCESVSLSAVDFLATSGPVTSTVYERFIVPDGAGGSKRWRRSYSVRGRRF